MSSYNRQPVFPVLMVAAGVVLILGSVFWMMNAAPTETIAGAPQAAGTLDPALEDIPTLGAANQRIPYPDIRRVSVGEAKAAYDAKSATFIDSRGQMYFDSAHIPGAIPLTDQEIPGNLPNLDRSTWIITYCT